METRIRYGLRRYPLMVAVFLSAGVGFAIWSRLIDGPTFIFPLGRLEPFWARLALGAFAAALIVYVGAMTLVRYHRRPEVVLRDGEVVLPVGEFGWSSLVLRHGDVLVLREAKTAGGWRVLHVQHRGGELRLASAQLPDDAAFERIRDSLAALASKEPA